MSNQLMSDQLEQPDLEMMLRGRPLKLPGVGGQILLPGSNDQGRLASFFSVLRRHHEALALFVIAGGLVGLGFARLHRTWYEARRSVAPQAADSAEVQAQQISDPVLLVDQIAEARAEVQRAEDYLVAYAHAARMALDPASGALVEKRFAQVKENIAGLEAKFPSDSPQAAEARKLVYALDFEQAKQPHITTLLSVINGMYTCGQAGEEGNKPVQQSVIERVDYSDLDGDGLGDVSIVARTGWVQRSEAEYQACVDWSEGKKIKTPRMRAPEYRIDYFLKGDRLVLAPESRAALARFEKIDKF